jgi:hypothetical protein
VVFSFFGTVLSFTAAVEIDGILVMYALLRP